MKKTFLFLLMLNLFNVVFGAKNYENYSPSFGWLQNQTVYSGVVDGYVKNVKNDYPLPNQTVTIVVNYDGTNIPVSTSTDGNGYFSFTLGLNNDNMFPSFQLFVGIFAISNYIYKISPSYHRLTYTIWI